MSASSPIVVRRAISRKALALAAAGIPIWIDARARVAHEKALIIDRRVTIMGSYNWSKGAASNSEDLNVVTSSEVAEAYAETLAGKAGGIGPVHRPCRNGAGDDRAGSAQYQRGRRSVPLTTISICSLCSIAS